MRARARPGESDARRCRLLHLAPLAGRGRIVEASASTIRVRGLRHMRGANRFKTNRARDLRRDQTDAERKLWNRIRSRSIDECKFVRQEPIGPYFVDLVCRERRLI